jgi:DNA-binding MarR family transcriptional regulator
MSTHPATWPGTASLLEVECICADVRRTARAVTQLYDAVLSPSGLRISQFIVLQVLDRLGSASQAQLSEAMTVAPETMSRRLDPMRRSGWIELHRGQDRRKKLYCLTNAGRQKLQGAFPYWKRAQRRLEMVINHAQLEQIKQKLDLLTKASQKAILARLSNTA